jgi:hypothetical protein
MDSGVSITKRAHHMARLIAAIFGASLVPAVSVSLMLRGGFDIEAIKFFFPMFIFSLAIIILGWMPIHFSLQRRGKTNVQSYLREGLIKSPVLGLLGSILVLPLLLLPPLF